MFLLLKPSNFLLSGLTETLLLCECDLASWGELEENLGQADMQALIADKASLAVVQNVD